MIINKLINDILEYLIRYEEALTKLQKYWSALKLSSSRRFSRIFASWRISSVELLSLTIVFALTIWFIEIGISIGCNKRISSNWRDNWALCWVICSIFDRCSSTRFVSSNFCLCRVLHSSIMRLSASVCTWMSRRLFWAHWFVDCDISFCILTSSRCSFFKPLSNFL